MAPDLAVLATPPKTVPGLIAELGKRGCKAAVVVTAGFGEGERSEGKELRAQMLDAARPHLLRIVGPNCLGFISPGAGINASFAHLDAGGRRPRLRHPVRRDRHRRARLGGGALASASPTSSRSATWPMSISATSSTTSRSIRQDAGDPALRREHHAGAEVHVGGPHRGAHQAGAGDQVRPQQGRRRRGDVAYRRARRRRTSSTTRPSGAPACCGSSSCASCSRR